MSYFHKVLVPFVTCLLVLDSNGDRIIAKYYNAKSKSEQTKFEATLHKKIKYLNIRTDGIGEYELLLLLSLIFCVVFLVLFPAEVFPLDQEIVVAKVSSDCTLIICGSMDEVSSTDMYCSHVI